MTPGPSFAFHRKPRPHRTCACGSDRVRVAGVEVGPRSGKTKVTFKCSSCGTAWVERPDPKEPR